MEELEIKDDGQQNGAQLFLKNHIMQFKKLKRLKIIDLQNFNILKEEFSSLERVEMQCAYYMEPRMRPKDIEEIFKNKKPGFTLVFKKFKFHALTE